MFGDGIHRKNGVRGGMGEVLCARAQMRSHGIFVDVAAVHFEITHVLDATLCKAVFPNGHFGFQAEGEVSFDELHGFLDGDVWRRRNEEMDVVGHEDEGVEMVAAFRAVVVEEVEKEVRVGFRLKEAAAIGGNGGDEEGADFLRGEVHAGRLARALVAG